MFAKAVEAPHIEYEYGIPFQTFSGVSANTRPSWSIASARRVVGYEPQDGSGWYPSMDRCKLVLEPAHETMVQGDARAGAGS
jgi:hypothetical protein